MNPVASGPQNAAFIAKERYTRRKRPTPFRRSKQSRTNVAELRRVGSAGGVRGPRGVADWSGVASRRRIEPCVRFSPTRLTDIVHRLAYAVVGRQVPLRR